MVPLMNRKRWLYTTLAALILTAALVAILRQQTRHGFTDGGTVVFEFFMIWLAAIGGQILWRYYLGPWRIRHLANASDGDC